MIRPEAQADWMRDNPARLAKVWRAAAETARQQFPNDTVRHSYYTQQAERLERSAEAQNG